MDRWTDFFIAVCYKSAVKYILSYWEACLFWSTVKPFTWAGTEPRTFSIVKKGYLKILLNIEGQPATLYNGLGPAQTSNCLFEPNSFRTLAVLLYLIVMVAGVGAKRLPTASNFQRLCLRNLWMAIPRESWRSHVPVTAKALLSNVGN